MWTTGCILIYIKWGSAHVCNTRIDKIIWDICHHFYENLRLASRIDNKHFLVWILTGTSSSQLVSGKGGFLCKLTWERKEDSIEFMKSCTSKERNNFVRLEIFMRVWSSWCAENRKSKDPIRFPVDKYLLENQCASTGTRSMNHYSSWPRCLVCFDFPVFQCSRSECVGILVG